MWTKSEQLLERAKQSLAGGVSSPFRAMFRPVPLYFRCGKGSRLEDVDGNSYIDYTLAWGPLILGHAPEPLVEAISAQLRRGMTFGAQHELEFAVSERIQSMVPSAERVAFTSSGSEALQLAFRLSRAFTGRNTILKFEGHYHGWMDSELLSYHPSREQVGPEDAPNVVLHSKGQMAAVASDHAVAGWNSRERLEGAFARYPGKIAAVVMESVLCNSGCIMPEPGYLEFAREITKREGALLILDEVITGFRIGTGGAQKHFGVTPDLATFGKAVAGGPALSVVAGRKDIVELIVGRGVNFGGTFNGNPISMAAADATLKELDRDGGEALARANRNGARLRDGIQKLANEKGIPLIACGFGAAFSVHFTQRAELKNYRDTFDDDPVKLQSFLSACVRRGVYSLPDGRYYTSTAHTDADIDESLAKISEALDEVA
jgi:glutamate-1-semialdehyde 2,1-aminomutase